MTVILINEDWHGYVGLAIDYASAVDYLIKEKWIDENFELYVEKTDSYHSIKKILGIGWEEKVASWNVEKFNEFFEGLFNLQEEEVHKIMDC